VLEIRYIVYTKTAHGRRSWQHKGSNLPHVGYEGIEGSGSTPLCVLKVSTIRRWSASCSSLLNPGERTHNTYCTGGWWVPERFWTLPKREQNLLPLSGIELSASHRIDYPDFIGITAGYERWCSHVKVTDDSSLCIMLFYTSIAGLRGKNTYSLKENSSGYFTVCTGL